ncbi:hypothetical protein [Neobacillus sp. D3-1R]|uniref:hypothetical protein n=1 Tax=Neobacillus sp. D3-1R TaxID=3445778 RepID=UPI003FA194CC
MSNVSIPRPPDVVTILWQRNPLHPHSPRTIVEATVIGSADPCNRFLRTGEIYACAKECLLENDFTKVFEERLGVFGLSVFVREC